MRKKISGWGVSGPVGDRGGGSRDGGWPIGRGLVAAMLVVGGDVGYGGCKPRRYCTM